MESVKALFDEQQIEIRKLRTEHEHLVARVAYLETLAVNSMSFNGQMDVNLFTNYQVQLIEGNMIENIDMFHQ